MLAFETIDGLSKPCPRCGAKCDHVLTAKLRRGEGVVYHCPSCDLGFLDGKPFDVKAFYESEYRKSVSHKAEGTSTHAEEMFTIYSRFQKQRLDLILPHITPQTDLLELGASAGQFLTHLEGKANRLCAIELDLDCCAFMADRFAFEISSDFFSDSPFADQTFDIVCSFQVLEHTPDPVAFLKDVYQALKPGGRAFIEVPNLYDPLLTTWKVPSYTQFYYHAEHLFYFSGEALKQACRDAGFAEDAMTLHFTQDYNLLNHLHWIMNDGPQGTCEIGLSEVKLDGHDPALTTWLSDQLATLNAAYIDKLVASGQTSNLLIESVKDT
nr:class I SAM-dependent methyltransferase [uncultured Cohaesibacter sp.]